MNRECVHTRPSDHRYEPLAVRTFTAPPWFKAEQWPGSPERWGLEAHNGGYTEIIAHPDAAKMLAELANQVVSEVAASADAVNRRWIDVAESCLTYLSVYGNRGRSGNLVDVVTSKLEAAIKAAKEGS